MSVRWKVWCTTDSAHYTVDQATAPTQCPQHSDANYDAAETVYVGPTYKMAQAAAIQTGEVDVTGATWVKLGAIRSDPLAIAGAGAIGQVRGEIVATDADVEVRCLEDGVVLGSVQTYTAAGEIKWTVTGLAAGSHVYRVEARSPSATAASIEGVSLAVLCKCM